MYRVYQNQAIPAYSSLYFFIFLSNLRTLNVFFTLFSGTVSPKKLKVGTQVHNGLLYRVYWNQTAAASYSSLYFFIFLSLQFSNINIFVAHFSGTMRPTKLILGTHMDKGLMYCVYQNQTAAAYSFLYFIFLSLQFSNIKIFTFLRNCEAYKVETWYTRGQRLDVVCVPKSCCCSYLSLHF